MNLSEKQIYNFLIDVDSSFPVPLSQKQDLFDYAKKLKEKATLVPIICDEKIAAMVAGYTENIIDNIAYISILATVNEARGRGYAQKVLQEFIQICRNLNYHLPFSLLISSLTCGEFISFSSSSLLLSRRLTCSAS